MNTGKSGHNIPRLGLDLFFPGESRHVQFNQKTHPAVGNVQILDHPQGDDVALQIRIFDRS
jgi:hypothetical protein